MAAPAVRLGSSAMTQIERKTTPTRNDNARGFAQGSLRETDSWTPNFISSTRPGATRYAAPRFPTPNYDPL